MYKLEVEVKELKARIAALEGALRPFAEAYNKQGDENGPFGEQSCEAWNSWGADWDAYKQAAALCDGKEDECLAP